LGFVMAVSNGSATPTSAPRVQLLGLTATIPDF
jgi:hypothetical protein